MPNHQMAYFEDIRRGPYQNYQSMMAPRQLDFYGYNQSSLQSFPQRHEGSYQVTSNQQIGGLDGGQSNIIIPSANKEPPKDVKDRVYMEDDDNKLHVPIPNRGLPFQKKEPMSAFRSSNMSTNPQLSKDNHQQPLKKEPEVYAHQGMAEGKTPLLRIELNLNYDDTAEKVPPEDKALPLKMEDEDEDDDDEDLFGDNSAKSSVKGKRRESDSLLDKRGETDRSDDEGLFVKSVY